MSPDGGLPLALIHPCSRPLKRQNKRRELAEVVNCCQRHVKCSDAYYLRKRKGTKEIISWFNYPRSKRRQPDVNKVANPK